MTHTETAFAQDCYVITQIIFDFSINKYQTNKYFNMNFRVAESYITVSKSMTIIGTRRYHTVV